MNRDRHSGRKTQERQLTRCTVYVYFLRCWMYMYIACTKSERRYAQINISGLRSPSNIPEKQENLHENSLPCIRIYIYWYFAKSRIEKLAEKLMTGRIRCIERIPEYSRYIHHLGLVFVNCSTCDSRVHTCLERLPYTFLTCQGHLSGGNRYSHSYGE